MEYQTCRRHPDRRFLRTCGGCDTCVLRKYAAELRRMAAPTTTQEQ